MKLVCWKCGKVWRGCGSPAVCPDCKEQSVAIARSNGGT